MRLRIPSFSVLLIMVVAAMIGLFTLPMLSVQYTPNKGGRSVSVDFTWPDASARIIEKEVSSKIEGALATIKGVTKISSYSDKGVGSVTLEFDKHTDMAAARFEVASQIRNLYPKLPGEVSYPAISLSTSGGASRKSMSYTLKADIPSKMIEEYCRNNIIVPLSRIEGVSGVSLDGMTPFEWVISFDPDALRSAGIDADMVAGAFNSYFSNDIIGTATVEDEKGSHSIVLKLQNAATPDFEKIPVTNKEGRVLHIGDFVKVRYSEAKPNGYFRINGLNTVTLNISMSDGSNLLRTAAEVRELMTELSRGFPPEITAQLTMDSSEYVSEEIDKIMLRTLLCVAILLVFVWVVSRNVHYLLIIFITLVVNLLSSVVIYNLLDIDIHIYTLAGISVSLGMMIDTSIIMVDHYTYYRNRNVFSSILGALLTTVGALSVIWLIPDEQRMNMEDFASVMIINLTMSLLVAYLFIPALLDKLPLKGKTTGRSMKRLRRTVRMNERYSRFICWGRRFRWLVLAAVVLGFGIPTFMLPRSIEDNNRKRVETGWGGLYNKTIGSSSVADYRETIDKILGGTLRLFHSSTNGYNYYREPEPKTLSIRAGMAEGCTVHQLNDLVKQMERFLATREEVDVFRTRVSSYDNASIEVSFKREYENTPMPYRLKQEVISTAADFGGATWMVSGLDNSYFNNRVVNSYRMNRINLSGYEYDKLVEYAEYLIEYLSTNRRVNGLQLQSSSGWAGRKEFVMEFDRERIAATGLNLSGYFDVLNNQLYDRLLSPVYMDGHMENVRLRSSDIERFDIWHITNEQVETGDTPTRLASVGRITKQSTGIPVVRENQSYIMSVGFDFMGPTEMARKTINEAIDYMNDEVLPIGFVASDPVWGWQRESGTWQVLIILLVVAIIYVMCAIIFESLRKPLVIITMIPVSFIGVFLAFGTTGFRFDQGGLAAFVLLCGVVVNAGIYLINEQNEWAERGRQKGVRLYIKAFNHKIIPIMLTIISTVLGLLPFLSDGPGEVFWFSFAVASIGGILFSIIALVAILPIFMPFKTKSARVKAG